MHATRHENAILEPADGAVPAGASIISIMNILLRQPATDAPWTNSGSRLPPMANGKADLAALLLEMASTGPFFQPFYTIQTLESGLFTVYKDDCYENACFLHLSLILGIPKSDPLRRLICGIWIRGVLQETTEQWMDSVRFSDDLGGDN